MPTTLKDQCAIVGIGQTEFSKNSGRSELQLTLECVKAAIEDAGLKLSDIDGLVTYSIDGSDEIAVARGLGLEQLTFFSRVPHGVGGAVSMVQQAAMAITSGMCEAVVCYRAYNGFSGIQPDPTHVGGPLSTDQIHWGWYTPYGFVDPASWAAMFTRRYMHEYDVSEETLAEVAVTLRQHGANNPDSLFYGQPITREDYLNAPYVVEPFRRSDICMDADGGCAYVITSAERAKKLPHQPAVIRGVAQGSAYDQEVMTSFYRSSITSFPEYEMVARQCYEMSDLDPKDIDVVSLYDPFTSVILFQLEAFGFCKQGEAKEFVKNGNLGGGGRLPCNTSGGQLSEAHIQGVNGVTEAVRLIRGVSVNQQEKVNHVLATAGFGVPASAMILGK